MNKICGKCKQSKPTDNFFAARARKDGLSWHCKECKRKAQRVHTLKTRFNMTLEDYEQMLAAQNGQCAICGIDNPGNGNGGGYGTFYVDHNHTTGEVRALLCSSCNLALGKFDDSIERLQAAIRYLKRY